MSDQEESFLGEPIPLEDNGGGPNDKRPAGGGDSDLFGTDDSDKTSVEPSRYIKTETGSALGQRSEGAFKRALKPGGQGATRVRTFHCKLGDAAMVFMDQQINEWADSHEDVEVKFCTSTIGVVEGKRQEPHLILTVWY